MNKSRFPTLTASPGMARLGFGIAMLALAGCASNNPPAPTDNGGYSVSRVGSQGAPPATVKAQTMKEAADFCHKKAMDLSVTHVSQGQAPTLTGGAPSTDIQFTCVAPR